MSIAQCARPQAGAAQQVEQQHHGNHIGGRAYAEQPQRQDHGKTEAAVTANQAGECGQKHEHGEPPRNDAATLAKPHCARQGQLRQAGEPHTRIAIRTDKTHPHGSTGFAVAGFFNVPTCAACKDCPGMLRPVILALSATS